MQLLKVSIVKDYISFISSTKEVVFSPVSVCSSAAGSQTHGRCREAACPSQTGTTDVFGSLSRSFNANLKFCFRSEVWFMLFDAGLGVRSALSACPSEYFTCDERMKTNPINTMEPYNNLHSV